MTHLGDETRSRLLEAAGEVFAEKGYRAATVREICARADANLAAVNYHFGDKQGLYVEAVKHAHGSGDDLLPPGWPPGTPPAVKLRDYIRRMLIHLREAGRPAWHAHLIAREMAQPTRACAEIVEGFMRPRINLLDEILGELMPRGASTIDRHLVAFSVISQCLIHRVPNPFVANLVGEEERQRYDIDRLTDHIARFSLAALGHERPFGEAAGQGRRCRPSSSAVQR